MPSDQPNLPAERQYNSQADVLKRAAEAGRGIKIGRPKTYHPDLCKRVIQLGSVGKSWAAIAREFGISRKVLYDWEAKYPEFSDALSRARAAAQAYWEDDVHENRTAKHYQAQAVRSVMAAQFEDYRDIRASGEGSGFDLGGFVQSIAQGTAAAMLNHTAPGASAKVIEGEASTLQPTPAERDKGK